MTTSPERATVVVGVDGAASTLLGGVSQYMLRRAPCPILVVPGASSAGDHG